MGTSPSTRSFSDSMKTDKAFSEPGLERSLNKAWIISLKIRAQSSLCTAASFSSHAVRKATHWPACSTEDLPDGTKPVQYFEPVLLMFLCAAVFWSIAQLR